VYKRQIYQIAESNRKIRFGSENRIETFFSPNLNALVAVVGVTPPSRGNVTYLYNVNETALYLVHGKTIIENPMYDALSRVSSKVVNNNLLRSVININVKIIKRGGVKL